MKYLLLFVIFSFAGVLSAENFPFQAKVTASALNVRNIPYAGGKKVGVIHKNSILTIEDMRNHWYKIGSHRWVYSKYLEKVSSQKVDLSENNYDKPMKIQEAHQGRITDYIHADLLYNYELMSLSLSNEIEEVSGSSRTTLADGGDYSFDTIDLSSKKIIISIPKFAFTYNDIRNFTQINNIESKLKEKLNVEITELIAGFQTLKKGNAWLNHTSEIQFFKRDAKFSGLYTRENTIENFKMDKTKYSLKILTDKKKFSSVLPTTLIAIMTKPKMNYIYYQFDYEDSTFPSVLYSTNTNNANLYILDKAFQTRKYTLIMGQDIVFDSGFLLGTSIGAGYSDVSLSEDAKTEVLNLGITNLDTSGTNNYRAGFKIGYLKDFVFTNASVELGALYNFEWFAEPSAQTASESNNGKAELVYQRREYLNILKFNVKVSF